MARIHWHFVRTTLGTFQGKELSSEEGANGEWSQEIGKCLIDVMKEPGICQSLNEAGVSKVSVVVKWSVEPSDAAFEIAEFRLELEKALRTGAGLESLLVFRSDRTSASLRAWTPDSDPCEGSLMGDRQVSPSEAAEALKDHFGRVPRFIAREFLALRKELEPPRRIIMEKVQATFRRLGHLDAKSTEEGQFIAATLNEFLDGMGLRLEVQPGRPGYVMYDAGTETRLAGFYLRAVAGRSTKSLVKEGFFNVVVVEAPLNQRRPLSKEP